MKRPRRSPAESRPSGRRAERSPGPPRRGWHDPGSEPPGRHPLLRPWLHLAATRRECAGPCERFERTPGLLRGRPDCHAAVLGSPASATPAPVRPKGTPFAEWAAANKFEGGRLAILQALAGLQRWCGFYDALTGTVQRQLVQLRALADTASAARRSCRRSCSGAPSELARSRRRRPDGGHRREGRRFARLFERPPATIGRHEP